MLRKLTLILILIFSVWALWPRRAAEVADNQATTPAAGEKAKHTGKKTVIKIAPKSFYMPGNKPFGVGKPIYGMDIVKKRYEALNPDTEIEYVAVPAAREWLVTQVSSGLAPDIVDVNVEEVWGDTHKGWYIPLDTFLAQPNKYAKAGEPGSKEWWDSLKYPGISRGIAAPDGKTYCVVYDMVETAIYYNKSIFKKVGVEVPADWIEFLEMQKKLRAAGYIPMLANSDNLADWGVDLLFDQFYQGILSGIDLRLEKPPRSLYLVGYLDYDEIAYLHENKFFTREDKRWLTLFRTLKEWRGYMTPDINAASTDFLKLFLNEKGAMLWDGSWRVHSFLNDPRIDFEWDMFYLPPIPKEYSPYADGHPMVVIGGPATQFVVTNSAIKDTGSSATSTHLRKCIDFLQFLTTPESSRTISNEVPVFLPNVAGVEPRPELEVFDEILKRRYSTTKWYFTFDQKFNEILLRMLELYLNEGISEDEFLEWMDRNLKSGISNIVRRQKPDMSILEKRWNELAPERAKLKDLPNAAK